MQFIGNCVNEEAMKREETVDYNMKHLWHAISRMYNQFGLPYDITASTGFVLLNIDVAEGTPATKIAPQLGMESRSLTRMLKSMEEKGWIYKEKDANDGRSVRVYLSDLGKEKREISRRAVKAFNGEVKNRVSKNDLNVFFRVAQDIGGIVSNENLFEKPVREIARLFGKTSCTKNNQV